MDVKSSHLLVVARRTLAGNVAVWESWPDLRPNAILPEDWIQERGKAQLPAPLKWRRWLSSHLSWTWF